jgi:hypothetical protein
MRNIEEIKLELLKVQQIEIPTDSDVLSVVWDFAFEGGVSIRTPHLAVRMGEETTMRSVVVYCVLRGDTVVPGMRFLNTTVSPSGVLVQHWFVS